MLTISVSSIIERNDHRLLSQFSGVDQMGVLQMEDKFGSLCQTLLPFAAMQMVVMFGSSATLVRLAGLMEDTTEGSWKATL